MRSNIIALLALLFLVAVVVVRSDNTTSSRSVLQLPDAHHQVSLVGLGGPSQPDLGSIADFIEKTTGQRPEIGPELRITPEVLERCYNPDRQQWDADKLVDLLEVPEGKVVIGIFDDTLYTSSIPAWRYCFGLKSHKSAILSPFNMAPTSYGEAPNPELTDSRLRKLILRYVLEMAYKMPRRNNPKSLLHNSVMGPKDLDAMEIAL